MKWFLATLAVMLALATGCTHRRQIPNDPRLEVFIQTMARFANIERTYSGDPEELKQRMKEADLSPDWKGLVDSLVLKYGGDPDLWQPVYEEILERSRLPAQEP